MTTARSSPSGMAAGIILEGLNMTVDSLDRLMPSLSQGRVYEWDYFDSGGNTSGSIGRMGWNLVGAGTPSYARQSASLDSPIKGVLSTSNVANNQAVLCGGEAINRQCIGAVDVKVSQFLVNLGSLANKRVFVGFQTNFNDNAQTTGNCTGFGYDSAFSPNWFIRNRVNGIQTIGVTTDLVASATDSVLFTLEQTMPVPASTISLSSFYAATVTAGGVVSPSQLLFSGVPNQAASNMNLGFKVQTLAAVVSTLGVGFWNLVTPPLTGFFTARNAPAF